MGMAQITGVPEEQLVARQELNSLLSAGLSILSSIVSESSPTSTSADSSLVSQTSGSSSNSFLFQTSQTSSSPSSSSDFGLSTGSPTTSNSESLSSSDPTSTTGLSSITSGSKSTTTSGSTPTNQASADKSSHRSGSNNKVPIILGVVLGLLALCLIALFVCLCLRRRRKRGYIFREKRPKSQDGFSDSDVGVDPLPPVVPLNSEYNPENSEHHRYPPPYQASNFRHSRGDSGYGDPFENGTRSSYDRRSRASLPLDPVTEQPDGELDVVGPPNGYRGRSWLSNSRRGSGFIPPGVPPRSPQRRSIPRKPVASPQEIRNSNSDFDFGFPATSEDYASGGNHTNRYYE
jgi:hypothetical protein